MRLLAVVLALLLLPLLADAQAAKPVVASGPPPQQLKMLPPNTTVDFNAGAAGNASINLPHGSAPSSPNNGDIWTTTAGVFAEVNGATISLGGGGGGGSPGGLSGQVQCNVSGSFGGIAATDAQLLIAQTSGCPLGKTISGDATLSDLGALTVSGIGGVTPGAFYSGTNAANLTGTAPASVLPAPTTSSFGGIEAKTCAAHQWVDVIPASAVQPTCAQPAFSDLSGNISTSQMNSGTGASSSTFWRGDGTWAAVTSGTVTQVNTNAPWTTGGPITATGTVDAGAVIKAAVSTTIMTTFGGL